MQVGSALVANTDRESTTSCNCSFHVHLQLFLEDAIYLLNALKHFKHTKLLLEVTVPNALC